MNRSLRIDVIEMDVFAAFGEWLDTPAKFGLTDVTRPAQSTCKKGDDVSGFLFWDAVHPTETGHSLLRERARKLLHAAYSI